MYNFYDTSSLLLKVHDLPKEEEPIIISSITLQELENIKTSNKKDEHVKYAARRFLRMVEEGEIVVEVVLFKEDMIKPIIEKGFLINDDLRILATAIWYDHDIHPDETVFYTNDLALRYFANLFFGNDSIRSVKEEVVEDYKGFQEIHMSEQEMADFYSNHTINKYNTLINQYLVIYNNNEVVDLYCWTGEEYRQVKFYNFRSQWFGDIKPYKGDIYQQMFCDSLMNNRITMVKGPAGSGKTFLSLSYLMYLLDKGKIDKIIVFCNTVATKNSAKLGYYPGTRDEKLLDSQIGNLLSSKMGGRLAVEQMLQNETLVLLPLSDIRGYDTSGMNAGIYISEAQNMDISLMKLALQRIGEDSICIIDGDCKTQVDDDSFAGRNNGMRRASEVFRGKKPYGEIELQTIHRSTIARIAEDM